MIVRLRSRDGLERVEVGEGSTLAGLKLTIRDTLGVPLDSLLLSTSPQLLTSPDPSPHCDLLDSLASLPSLHISHGTLLFMRYEGVRHVAPVHVPNAFESRPFGAHMSVEELIAKQTRIERQEEATCKSVSFERVAANVFQSYVRDALAFSIKRGGVLYGTVDQEAGTVSVEVIYEPPQEAGPSSLTLQPDPQEEALVAGLAEALGLVRVGCIFAQSTEEKEHIVSARELCDMAAVQSEVGELSVAAVVSLDQEAADGGHVHFEAFQCSKQAVRLHDAGWMVGPSDTSGQITLRNPEDPKHEAPVIVAGKDAGVVDSDWFLCPVAVQDHAGSLGAAFPVENRLLPQGLAELKQYMLQRPRMSYRERVADFHLLLFLGRQAVLEGPDLMQVARCVAAREDIPEGYEMIIDGLLAVV